jgi:hypothetical protein
MIIRDFILNIFKRFFYRLNKDIALEMQKRALKTTVDYVEANMLNVKPVNNKFVLLEKALAEVKISGMHAEFGVYKGKTINYIAKIKKTEKIYGFDSFQGLPEFWRDEFDKGTFKLEELPGVLKNVILIKGLFADSLKEFLANHPENFAFLHIDSDLYSSAATILNLLKGKIIKGTIIVFDEFFNYSGWEKGEFKAFNEFTENNKLNFEFISYTKNDEQVAIKII